ncbi:MAG: hypothetical protein GXO23_04920 [Crenarchaeota archaeon]|nr:hypothetical protein [Thermoproteota archaeon]
MHEWSIVYGILSSIKESYGDSIRYVKISIGELVQIDLDVFKFALEEVSKMLGFKNEIKYDIEIEKTKFRCTSCGHVWTWKDVESQLESSVEDRELAKTFLEAIHLVPSTVYAYIRCPRCGSPDFEIIEGSDIKVLEVR